MAIAVNLYSEKGGEIRRFLERYYEKGISMEEDVGQWTYVYHKPLEAVDIICALMDNKDKFQITVSIQLDVGKIHTVTAENHNDIIRGIFNLFYDDSSRAVV